MAKYSFKVYLQGGNYKIVTPNNMTNTDLHDMDKFVYENQGFFGLCDILSKELNIQSHEIDSIKILRNRKQIEFSLANTNKYLNPVLDDLEKKVIQGNGPYKTEAIVIKTSNEAYKEMSHYLFSNVERDHNFFLNEIYDYNNEFSELLNKYGQAFKQSSGNEEDERYIRELKEKIAIELSVYKNYRGLCRARKKFEERAIRRVNTNHNNVNRNNLHIAPEINSNATYNLTREFNETRKLTQEFNREYDEFLEEEEYESMMDDTTAFRGYK